MLRDLALALSLASGIILLLMSIIAWAFLPYFPWRLCWGMMCVMGWLWPGLHGFFWFYTTINIVSGIIILFGAVMLHSRPEAGSRMGTVILAASVVSLVGMGGFIVGAVLGILGGILAILSKVT